MQSEVQELKKQGVEFKGKIFEAPGFIIDIATTDLDSNVIEIAQ